MADVITFPIITKPDGTTEEQVLITHDDGSITSMLKATYDAQQTAQASLEAKPTK
jgi:hypothetical protein